MRRDEAIFLPFARTKRPHRKSRLSCELCKQRRVKVRMSDLTVKAGQIVEDRLKLVR